MERRIRILRELLVEAISNIDKGNSNHTEDEKHLALYIKDTIDDYDASDETTFRRWVATMIGNGNPIDWYEII